MSGTLKTPETERLEVKTEPILWHDIVELFVVWILRGCGAGLISEKKDEWGVMWLQQAESINQEIGDIPNKAEREENKMHYQPYKWH